MAWTAPASYGVSEVLQSSKLNTHLRDNLNYLKGNAGQVDIANSMSINGYLRLGSAVTPGRAIDAGTTGSWSDSSGIRLTGGSPGVELCDTQGSPQRWLLLNGTGSANDGYFSVYDLKGGTPALVLTPSTRRLGIGTTVPASKADINGNLTVGSYAGTNAAPTNGAIISGALGVGTVNPLGKFHAHDGLGGLLFWSTAISGADITSTTPQEIAPDGTITYGAYVTMIGRGSSGETRFLGVGGASGDLIEIGVTRNASIDTDILTFTVTAGGGLTVHRASGSLSHKIAVWVFYL